VEPEFHLEAHHVDVSHLDRLIQAHILPGQQRPALAAKQLNGMLKGFIDLLFEYNGKYYVLDYKSNWLGNTDTAYDNESLNQAILAKRYDVQYCLYLLATHRLLRYRLGDTYDYQQHMGGTLYYFIRGVNHSNAGCHFCLPDLTLIEQLDLLFRGELPAGVLQ
jgi:exodeoxyribonuclease V beta subunit